MVTTNNRRPQGRPRRFDADEAIAIAQQLFHARGYDAVSVADLTEAFGIKPPSFYAAFGSKMGLYTRVLERYTCTHALPFATILSEDRPVGECLAALLQEAARLYAGDAAVSGCMVVQGTQSSDTQAREAACVFHDAAEKQIHSYIAARYPAQARRMTDFVSTTMTGLSAKARSGYDLERLLETARLAGEVLIQALPAEKGSER